MEKATETIMPEENRLIYRANLAFLNGIGPPGTGRPKILFQVGVVRNEVLRPTVVQNGSAEFLQMEVAVAQIVIEMSIADFLLSDDSLVKGCGLSDVFRPFRLRRIDGLLEEVVRADEELRR
jgi:hypothetical protein